MSTEEIEEHLKTAHELSRSGSMSDAESVIERILVYLTRDDSELSAQHRSVFHARALLQQSWITRQRSQYASALEQAELALTISEQCHEPALQARALGSIGATHIKRGDYSLALEFLDRALTMDEELGNKESASVHLGSLGSLHRQLANYQLALDCYNRAVVIDEEIGNKAFMASDLGGMGVVYVELSDFSKALDCYRQALHIDEELGNRSGVAVWLGNIGQAHSALGDLDKALDYYRQALRIDEEMGNKAGMERHLGNIGNVYTKLAAYQEAAEYNNKALSIAEEIGNQTGIAIHLSHLGTVFEKVGESAKALEHLQRSLQLYEEQGRKMRATEVREAIGGLYVNGGDGVEDEQKAEEYLLASIAIHQTLGTTSFNVHKALSQLYKKQGRLSEAIQHYEHYDQLKEQVQNAEAKKHAQHMDYRRKIEDAERDRQLKIARHDITVQLLHKALPPSIVERLMNDETDIADRFESVSILFADIVGFTPLSARIEPKALVGMLNNLFSRFDNLTETFGVERIKTIGDAYMCVSGAPLRCDDHASRIARVALAMLDQTRDFCQEYGENIEIRIGINSGEAIGAVVGVTKFSYDLWSDAVNMASRMESYGEASRIHVTAEFKKTLEAEALVGTRFVERGTIDVKGKGHMRTYFLEGV